MGDNAADRRIQQFKAGYAVPLTIFADENANDDKRHRDGGAGAHQIEPKRDRQIVALGESVRMGGSDSAEKRQDGEGVITRHVAAHQGGKMAGGRTVHDRLAGQDFEIDQRLFGVVVGAESVAFDGEPAGGARFDGHDRFTFAFDFGFDVIAV